MNQIILRFDDPKDMERVIRSIIELLPPETLQSILNMQKKCAKCGNLHTRLSEFCSDKCYQKRYHREAYSPREKEKKTRPRPCEYCNKVFQPIQQDARYCSRRCSQAAWKARKRLVSKHSNLSLTEIDKKLKYIKENYPAPIKRPEF